VTLPSRICPECGEEYLHTVLVCAECGIALGSERSPARAAPELPAAEQLVAVRNAEVVWIQGLAEALAEEGIPCRAELPRREDGRVQGQGTGAVRCTLYVRAEDAEAAARVDAEFARSQVPDLPEDASSAWREADGCPACSAALPPDAPECPECGLAFAGED
jgi:hypothetical protein